VLFQQVQAYDCALCALEVLFQQVQASSCQFVLLKCCFNKFKFLAMLFVLLKCCFIKFKLLAMFFMFLKSILAFCDFWILVVVSVLLSHQVLASTCVLEIHVGLFDLVFMFLRCFHFSFNYSEPSSCSPLVK
jgi:hypothetical protein